MRRPQPQKPSIPASLERQDLTRIRGGNLADPVSWGEFAAGEIAANPIYSDPNSNFENPLYGGV